jgi:hypothetical protein
MRLSAEDYGKIRTLRGTGVLEDTDATKLGLKRRFVAIACADGDRSPELLDFHRGHGSECMHFPNRNGGALILAPSSPLANRGNLPHGECCLFEIAESCAIKNTNEVVLYGHFPCAAAAAYNIPVLNALELLIEAKDNVRSKITDAQVSLFIQVDYDGQGRTERFKTYFFNRKKFNEWQQAAQALVA